MPEILDRCVSEVMEKGHSEQSAFAICRSSLGLNRDGSDDAKDPGVPEGEMRSRVLSEMTKMEFGSYPMIRKRIQICEAVGEFVNGDQEGELTLARFRKLIDNFRKYPRQVPAYLIVGDMNPEHPTDLDARLADGWIEGLSMEGRYLMGDLKANGKAAIAILQDGVRGASIGTVFGTSYDGAEIGEVLEHVVLTNNPYVKGMNIAARAKGGARIAYHFTAFKKEAPVADEKKKDPAPAADDVLTMKADLEAAQGLLAEKEKQVRELSENNEDLQRELKERQKNSDLELALKENKALLRQVTAGKIRELVSLGVDRGQFNRDKVKGHDGGDDRSDALTMAWFKNSIFEGDMEKLKFALKTFPKTEMRRTFSSGSPLEDDAAAYSPDKQEQIRAQGHDPELLAKVRGASNLTDYKRRKAAAAKG